nr:hypothetical protein [Anaerolineae bacterium]
MTLAYVEYELEDGTIIEIAAPPGVEVRETHAGETFSAKTRGIGDEKPEQSVEHLRFSQALSSVKQSAKELMVQLRELQADEIEVEFGLSTTGKAGNFAIGSVSLEANYIVKLKWSNKDTGK